MNCVKRISLLRLATTLAPVTILKNNINHYLVNTRKYNGTKCYQLVSPRNFNFPRYSIYFKFRKLQTPPAIPFTSPQSHCSVNAWEETQNPLPGETRDSSTEFRISSRTKWEQYWDIWINVESRKILPVVSASPRGIRNYLSYLSQMIHD